MSPEAQRIAIAEACGWFPMGKLPEGERWWGRSLDADKPNAANKFKLAGLPNYLTDLNAMHEAEKTLTRVQYWNYADMNLKETVWKDGPPNRAYQCATAAERAEAFLRTIGKWNDSK